jgi:catechol 2,3-dioxygenase-like lactoylglutathione lyase family enzyme
MKRFHVHVAVDDLAQSTRFYSALFGAQPAVEKSDYAKWMLDDPRINFAISQRGSEPGINHLGFQVESDDELAALQSQHNAAGLAVLNEGQTTCCYAESEKHWVTDPQGIAWEMYRTMGEAVTFNGKPEPASIAAAIPAATSNERTCCAPSCCAPTTAAPATTPKPTACCG